MTHTHHHEHASKDLATTNKEYFDKHVHIYDTPDAIRIAEQQALAIRATCKLDKEMTILDFAGGHGQIARDLIRDVKSIVGVDISEEAIKKYNELSIKAGYSPDILKGLCFELKGEERELDGAKFDLVICCMAYHHFPDCNQMTRILTSHLKPNGVLCVIDKLKPEQQPSDAPAFSDEVKKVTNELNLAGFVKDDMRGIFEQAGLKDFSFETAFDGQWGEHKFRAFIAKGTK
ncbi:S-adenosyl-L-methionine-dependent methyltransferase [Panaeolus papilionaceus]|nr:S-adenosyl-L-methionine-dependent methyltransferase [Panaeolus papilionaceus]